jgi:hypothetical protein
LRNIGPTPRSAAIGTTCAVETSRFACTGPEELSQCQPMLSVGLY